MKISIITCTFNRLDKLKRNIQSVISQSYDDYEHFIIDDGSTDGTKDYIDKLDSKKIIYYESKTNLGQPQVMFESKVLDKISGDLVFLLDSDDYLLENAIKTIVEDFQRFAKKNPQTIAYSYEKNYNDVIYEFVNSNDILQDTYPLNLNNNGFKDFLFVQSTKYIKNFNSYFTEASKWYSSRIEFAISKNFLEIYTNKVIYHMDFGSDTVTRGSNIDKYKDITLFTRKYYFDNFKKNMGEKYIKYTINSLLLNFLINKENKKYFKDYFKIAKKLNFLNINQIVFYNILNLIPSKILFKIKIYIKKRRLKR